MDFVLITTLKTIKTFDLIYGFLKFIQSQLAFAIYIHFCITKIYFVVNNFNKNQKKYKSEIHVSKQLK